MDVPERRFVASASGLRLDRFVADAAQCGRRRAADWIRSGRVRVDDRIAASATLLASGQVVTIEIASNTPRDRDDRWSELRVLVEDEDTVVMAKPAGLHCERGRSPHSVAEALQARYGAATMVGDRAEEGGLVHRLDWQTSGVLMAARRRDRYRALRDAFARSEVEKTYLALVVGPVERSLAIAAPLARRKGRMVPARGRDRALEASTEIEPLESGPRWSLVQARTRTGVMHQVRVHLAAAGCPIVGDQTYGGGAAPAGGRRGQLLHAFRVRVTDDLDVTAPPPPDFLEALAFLRGKRP